MERATISLSNLMTLFFTRMMAGMWSYDNNRYWHLKGCLQDCRTCSSRLQERVRFRPHGQLSEIFQWFWSDKTWSFTMEIDAPTIGPNPAPGTTTSKYRARWFSLRPWSNWESVGKLLEKFRNWGGQKRLGFRYNAGKKSTSPSEGHNSENRKWLWATTPLRFHSNFSKMSPVMMAGGPYATINIFA